MEITKLINDYLIFWILISVIIGLLFPQISIFQPLSTLILAIMIGSISLTLSFKDFRNIKPTVAINLIIVQLSIPFFAFGIASLLGLSTEIVMGFVILGAVTPELVSPVMTQLSDGDTALSTSTVVITGFLSVLLIPSLIIILFSPGIEINITIIVIDLFLAVISPMILAFVVRHRWAEQISGNDDIFSSISSVMVIIIMMIVTATNSELIFNNTSTLILVSAGVIILNLLGYLIGWLLGKNFAREEQITAVFSTGMRDFAVAAALILSADLPKITALPAITFGIFEMMSSSALVKIFNYGKQD